MRRKTLRTIVVGLTVFLTTFDSATAFHLFGCFRGGYRSCGSSWGRSYYYGSGGCSSGCGSGYVVYHGGYGSGCGGCSDCGGGVVVEDAAPGAVYQTQPTPHTRQQPATVNKMQEPTMPPRLPGDSMMQRPAGGDTESMQKAMPTQPVWPSDQGVTPRQTIQEPTQPQRTTPVDDVFGPAGGGGATQPTTPTTPPGGDLFERMPTGGAATTPTTPTTTPTTPQTPTTTPAGGGLEDLFPPTGGGGTTPTGGGATPPAGGATPPGDTKSTPLDDLFPPTGGGGAITPTTPPAGNDPFKSSAVLRESGGLASDQDREWVDNTGRYTTRGRLVTFLDGHVRLLKENGRTTTVPLARLSQNDLEFVNRQASAQRATEIERTVRADVAVTPLAAN
ncbi:MAG: SHD1 domain-containing protein [Pirellulales bacterium]